jgi:hypothetical protein
MISGSTSTVVQHYTYEYIRNAEYTVDSMQVSGTQSIPVAQYSIVKPTVRWYR